jgi:[ribosomal protein S5]-alanine N-acetyltransferase
MTAVTRLLSPGDAPVLAELYTVNKEFFAPFEPVRTAAFYTVEGQRKSIGMLLEEHQHGRNLPHVILDGNGEVIGRITINTIVRGASQSGTVGYWVSEHASGAGYATRAVAEIKRIAFGQLDLHRLEAGTLVHNVRSQRVLERNGFQRYGLAPRMLRIGGKWQDHIMYQVLNERMV